MKTLFVTYTQGGVVKKGRINEDRYNQMKNDSSISDIVIYPSELIMENNYSSIVCADGSCTNRGRLLG